MTRTVISLDDLRKDVPHLADRLQQADADWHILQWGNAEGSDFEVACKGGTPDQLKTVDRLLSQAYLQAAESLS